jgi:hypothetical protein
MIFNPKNFMLMKALFGGNSGSSGDPGEVLDGLEIVPDFSNGDHEVAAPAGCLVSSAIIKKPETLVPTNIAEGVDIAGVVGTLESGGGAGNQHYVFNYVYSVAYFYYNLAASAASSYHGVSLPPNSVILCASFDILGVSLPNPQTNKNIVNYTKGTREYSLNQYTTELYLRFADVTFTRGNYYTLVSMAAFVAFYVPGIYLLNNSDGAYMYADSSVTIFPKYVQHRADLTKADLRDSNISTIPAFAFRHAKIPQILLPPSVYSIESSAMNSDGIDIVDFSMHTAVPTIQASSFLAHDGLEIRVPAALYDQWIASTNWSTFADYIVAV